jgi:hypothetical protein
MNKILCVIIGFAILAFAGCAPSLLPVPGAPEVHAPEGVTSVTVMPDGTRYVIVNVGESVYLTVLLPPSTPKNVEK